MNVLKTYAEVNHAIRTAKARAVDAYDVKNNGLEGMGFIANYFNRDLERLEDLWPEDLPKGELEQAWIAASKEDFYSVFDTIFPKIERLIDLYFAEQSQTTLVHGLEGLLHPLIVRSSYSQYRSGQYRDAVLNAVTAVFDLIRRRTNLDLDGRDLTGKVFSLERPMLVFSTLETESGRNDQKGFIQILEGACTGIRNPKAHSLESNLSDYEAGQYLVFCSLLMRRIESAVIMNPEV